MQKQALIFNINGQDVEVLAQKNWTMLYVLREVLNLTGTKCGCKTGDCGACKILVDGRAVNSCTLPANKAVGKHIQTIEGLANGSQLHPIQKAFIEAGAIQCGYCTPGMVITAKALLDSNPNPSDDEIKEALNGNLCRCTGYVKIVNAIKLAARWLQEAKG